MINVIGHTIDTMQAVAGAMAAIVLYWREGGDSEYGRWRVKNSADLIETSYADIDLLQQSVREYIRDEWNELLGNDARVLEMNLLIAECDRFKKAVAEFEDEFCRHSDEAFEMFRDEWIAREYLVLCMEVERKMKVLGELVKLACSRGPDENRPLRGIARAFKAYFAGVSEEEVIRLVKDKIPFSKRVKWQGDRDEAVIFAWHFSLAARHMNKSFYIHGRNTPHRNLNLYGDRPVNGLDSYDITPILNRYPKY